VIKIPEGGDGGAVIKIPEGGDGGVVIKIPEGGDGGAVLTACVGARCNFAHSMAELVATRRRRHPTAAHMADQLALWLVEEYRREGAQAEVARPPFGIGAGDPLGIEAGDPLGIPLGIEIGDPLGIGAGDPLGIGSEPPLGIGPGDPLDIEAGGGLSTGGRAPLGISQMLAAPRTADVFKRLYKAFCQVGDAICACKDAFTETKKHSPNTGARANNTLHKSLG